MSPSNVTQTLPELSNSETEMSAAFADDASKSMQASPTQAARMLAGENVSALAREIKVLAPTLARLQPASAKLGAVTRNVVAPLPL